MNLKSCPFCGNETTYYGHDDATSFVVQCLRCGAKGGSVHLHDIDQSFNWGTLHDIECEALRIAKVNWNRREK